jgi:hypothetical protein
MNAIKPAGWTLNKTQLKARGWTSDDVASRLGEGRAIDWKGVAMTVWPLAEIQAAEATDQAFAARLADASERAARRALNKAIRAKEIQARIGRPILQQ